MPTFAQHLFALEPQYRERVWGGRRLLSTKSPIGEAWLAYGPSRVIGGGLAGRTIDELIARHGAGLLGTAVADRFGTRFPLLIKLLDCADWLSIQVHPDDEQAARLVKPGEFGKTEAWFFLDANPGAEIIVGVKPGVGPEELADRIRDGGILSLADRFAIHEGDALLIPAGTLHALGPGLLLYEIQQASDTTYRVYDWDRPRSAGRKLNIEASVEVARPVGPRRTARPQVAGETGSATAVECSFFRLELLRVSPGGRLLDSDTAGRSFHLITAIDGAAEIVCGPEKVRLGRFETTLVAGSAGSYDIRAEGGPATLLRADVPTQT